MQFPKFLLVIVSTAVQSVWVMNAYVPPESLVVLSADQVSIRVSQYFVGCRCANTRSEPNG